MTAFVKYNIGSIDSTEKWSKKTIVQRYLTIAPRRKVSRRALSAKFNFGSLALCANSVANFSQHFRSSFDVLASGRSFSKMIFKCCFSG